MNHAVIGGLSLLVLEDEPLIAMDIAMAFEACGAHVTSTNTLGHAVLLVEHDGLCGAILDHALPDGDSSLLCTHLKDRGMPFLICSGFQNVEGAREGPPFPAKLAPHATLVGAMADLIQTASRSAI